MMTSALWHLFSALVSIVAGTSFSPNASFTNIAFETIEPAAGIRTRRDRRDKRDECGRYISNHGSACQYAGRRIYLIASFEG